MKKTSLISLLGSEELLMDSQSVPLASLLLDIPTENPGEVGLPIRNY
jgi:hypothetical protein